MTKYRKYKKAFRIACDLLNGSVLYGYDTDRIFEEMMKKNGVVSIYNSREKELKEISKLGKKYEYSTYYNKFYNGKLEEEHADLNIALDLCKECNEEVVDFVYNEYCQFRRKVDNENLIKLFKEK